MNRGAKGRPIALATRGGASRLAAHGFAAPLALHEEPRLDDGGRRIVDDCGRSWIVREFAALTIGGNRDPMLVRVSGLHFRCEQPGQVPQLRRAWLPLTSFSDEDLLAMIQRQVD